MEWLDILQWPAMVFTICGAWLVTSQAQVKRMVGFWSFLFGNVLWIVWGMHDSAWALVTLQFFLTAINISGARKNASDEAKRELKEAVE